MTIPVDVPPPTTESTAPDLDWLAPRVEAAWR